MLFEQVRIPLFYMYKDRERAYSVKKLGSEIRKYLSSEFDLESKVENDGLGKVTIFIGHK